MVYASDVVAIIIRGETAIRIAWCQARPLFWWDGEHWQNCPINEVVANQRNLTELWRYGVGL